MHVVDHQSPSCHSKREIHSGGHGPWMGISLCHNCMGCGDNGSQLQPLNSACTEVSSLQATVLERTGQIEHGAAKCAQLEAEVPKTKPWVVKFSAVDPQCPSCSGKWEIHPGGHGPWMGISRCHNCRAVAIHNFSPQIRHVQRWAVCSRRCWSVQSRSRAVQPHVPSWKMRS